MPTPSELLNSLQRRGVRIEAADADRLLVQPANRLTDADREAIRSLKPDLLRLLADPYRHACVIAGRCAYARSDLARHLKDNRPNLCDEPLRKTGPAESIVATCQRYGIELQIDSATGGLIIGKAGARADESSQPWPSLLRAIEAHLEAIVAVVRSGWMLKINFPVDRQIAA